MKGLGEPPFLETHNSSRGHHKDLSESQGEEEIWNLVHSWLGMCHSLVIEEDVIFYWYLGGFCQAERKIDVLKL